MPRPVVVIIGRPNVGKSTLFNRLTGSSFAVVEKQPGVTRDRLYKEAEWAGYSFILVDTGGLDFLTQDEVSIKVRSQVELAIQDADVILFVVDARSGLTSTDEEIADLLRRAGKPLLLVANKVEQFDAGKYQPFDFYRLGLGDPIPVSAAEGLNTGDLLDKVVAFFPERPHEEYPDDPIKIAVAGRPNVGKSSLVNAILGQERVIVDSRPGTTRDAIDTFFKRGDKQYLLIDTAGMRRKSKVSVPTERYSVIRALKAIDRCDITLLVLDAQEGVTEQDKRIAGYVHEGGKSSILVVNKWDLVEKDHQTMLRYTKSIREELGFIQYAPVVYISALTGQRVSKILELVDHVIEQYLLRIHTAGLNILFQEALLQNPPPAVKGKRLKVYYVTQKAVKPPTFLLFVNNPEMMHFSYLRYLENQLRAAYGFKGTPLRIFMRRK